MKIMQTNHYSTMLLCLGILLGSPVIHAEEDLCPDEGLFTSEPEQPIELIATDNLNKKTGVWLPEDPVLFKPFVADPREVDYSAGWRLNDNVLAQNVIDVSFGDIITFYRWCDVGPWRGQLDISLEGGLWAVFAPLEKTSPLLNADYYVGIPVTYAFGPWAFRLRGFHISSHLGDEFLLGEMDCSASENLKQPYIESLSFPTTTGYSSFHRRNPSAEYLDFFVSYYLQEDIRLYSGVGVVVAMDKSFPIGRFYLDAGAELHMSQLGFVDPKSQVYGRPFYGMHFHYQTQHERHIDQTYVLGYEWGKLCGLQRVLRAFIEYHDGYSCDGQFYRFPTNYFSARVSYGF